MKKSHGHPRCSHPPPQPRSLDITYRQADPDLRSFDMTYLYQIPPPCCEHTLGNAFLTTSFSSIRQEEPLA